MSHGFTRRTRTGLVALVLVVLAGVTFGQQKKNFNPVEGANLKEKIDAAIVAGRANAVNGRFWVAYQFEVRPGVAVDFEVVDSAGVVYISSDSGSSTFDSRYETRELGLFLLYDTQRNSFIRADVYNLRRDHEYSNYPVYWAGRVTNEESLNFLKSLIDAPGRDSNNLAGRAVFALSVHDDVRVDAMLTELIRRPVAEPLRSRAITLLGNTPESQAKNTFFSEIIRNNQETTEARLAAMSALSMSRSAAVLPLLENLFGRRLTAARKPLHNDDHARAQTPRAARHRPQRQ